MSRFSSFFFSSSSILLLFFLFIFRFYSCFGILCFGTLFFVGFRKLVSTILTNPMYMIGLFFLVKRGFQKLVEIGKEDEEL